jgi:hypothetical protein
MIRVKHIPLAFRNRQTDRLSVSRVCRLHGRKHTRYRLIRSGNGL